MIIKILSKVKIHFLTYVVAFICALTSHFKEFIFISLIIVLHELGHIICLLLYKWKIEKIIMLPFGGVTVICDDINKPLKEEFVIAIMGPIIQIASFFFLKNIFSDPIYYYLNMYILVFNLLPIYPLDGAKICNVILNKIFPFKLSHFISIAISFFMILSLLLMFKFDLFISMVMLFIIFKVVYEYRNHQYYFNKFVLERMIKDFHFKKSFIVKSSNINKMYRDKRHLFLVKDNYLTEKEFLRKRFDFKGKVC